MAIQDIVQSLQQNDIIYAVIIVIAAYLIGEIAKFTIRKIAKRLARKTKTSLDDELIAAMEKPILWGITLAGFCIALLTITALADYRQLLITIYKVLGILWGCWAAIRVVGGLFKWYADEVSIRTESDMDDKYLHIFRRITNLIIFAIVGMLILQSLGIAISPLIAGLGIGGLAIGLALQDTLANFFGGFYLITDRAIKIGDYVEIEAPTGTVTGHVEDIGWRTSKLKTLTDNHVIVPNKSFSNATVINYQAPKADMSLIVPIGVSYSSDLDQVEKVTLEVIKDVQDNVDGGKKKHKALIRYKAFADSSINLIAIIRIRDPAKQGFVRHEFIKRLKRRYDQEGIEIPFPIRTIIQGN